MTLMHLVLRWAGQALAGVLLAGVVLGVLVPLLPGVFGPWSALLVILTCIAVVVIVGTRWRGWRAPGAGS